MVYLSSEHGTLQCSDDTLKRKIGNTPQETKYVLVLFLGRKRTQRLNSANGYVTPSSVFFEHYWSVGPSIGVFAHCALTGAEFKIVSFFYCYSNVPFNVELISVYRWQIATRVMSISKARAHTDSSRGAQNVLRNNDLLLEAQQNLPIMVGYICFI